MWENTIKNQSHPSKRNLDDNNEPHTEFSLTHQSLFKSYPHIDFHIPFCLLCDRNRHICEFHWLFSMKISIVVFYVRLLEIASNVKFIIFKIIIFIGRLSSRNKAFVLLFFFFYIRWCYAISLKNNRRLCHVRTIDRDRFTMTFQESCQGMFFFFIRIRVHSKCVHVRKFKNVEKIDIDSFRVHFSFKTHVFVLSIQFVVFFNSILLMNEISSLFLREGYGSRNYRVKNVLWLYNIFKYFQILNITTTI